MHRKDMFQGSFNLDTVVFTSVQYSDKPVPCTPNNGRTTVHAHEYSTRYNEGRLTSLRTDWPKFGMSTVTPNEGVIVTYENLLLSRIPTSA